MRQAHSKLVTGQQMASIDKCAIDGGIAGAILMERAGEGIIQVLSECVGGLSGAHLVILCGRGNNGGDGFVASRLATGYGARIRTFLFARKDAVEGDAAHHLRLATDAGIHVEEVLCEQDLLAVHESLARSSAAVDALLGTGIRGSARGTIAQGIKALETAPCPIVAVDVPSGLASDTGDVEGPCATAEATVTFALPKRGHFLYPGRSRCGRLHVWDIGIPGEAVDAEGVKTHLLAAHGCAALQPRRSPSAHKGDCGRVAIVAGTVGLTGAAALSALGALRGGAGLVTVGVPESLNDILEARLTEAMTRPLPEVRKSRCLSLRARGDIGRLMAGADAVALGPGLGTHRETVALVRRLLADIRVPAVLDADALNALAGEADSLASSSAGLVVTPHPGEFSRLTGTPIADVLADPLGSARTLAGQTGAVVVLKGAPTVVASPCGALHVNPSGNAGMATGGAGDVLTGLIASLLAQGLPAEDAACLGVYTHGLAGDLAAESKGQAGMIAGDIVDALPHAEKCIHQGDDVGRYVTFHTVAS